MYSLGRAAMLFRRWMPSAYMRRFSKQQYDFESQEMYEGYYRTTFEFTKNLIRDLKQGQLLIGTRLSELSTLEKANLKRAITEISTFVLISLALGMFDWGEGSDRPWLEKLAEYELRRLQTEIGALAPFQTGFLKQAGTILSSPMAGMDSFGRIIGVVDGIGSWGDTIQSGNYKGHTKLYKGVFELIPGSRAVIRTIDPNSGIAFYK